MKRIKLKTLVAISGATSIVGLVLVVFSLLSMTVKYDFNWYSLGLLIIGIIGSAIFGSIYTKNN